MKKQWCQIPLWTGDLLDVDSNLRGLGDTALGGAFDSECGALLNRRRCENDVPAGL